VPVSDERCSAGHPVPGTGCSRCCHRGTPAGRCARTSSAPVDGRPRSGRRRCADHPADGPTLEVATRVRSRWGCHACPGQNMCARLSASAGRCRWQQPALTDRVRERRTRTWRRGMDDLGRDGLMPSPRRGGDIAAVGRRVGTASSGGVVPGVASGRAEQAEHRSLVVGRVW
jgi:hypothetical protein